MHCRGPNLIKDLNNRLLYCRNSKVRKILNIYEKYLYIFFQAGSTTWVKIFYLLSKERSESKSLRLPSSKLHGEILKNLRLEKGNRTSIRLEEEYLNDIQTIQIMHTSCIHTICKDFFSRNNFILDGSSSLRKNCICFSRQVHWQQLWSLQKHKEKDDIHIWRRFLYFLRENDHII